MKLFTLGGFFVWWFIDIFLISDAMKKNNLQKLQQAIGGLSSASHGHGSKREASQKESGETSPGPVS